MKRILLLWFVSTLTVLGQTQYSFTNFAGHIGIAANGDGTNGGAYFNTAFSLARDNADNLYVSDYYNNEIRKVTPAGVVTTLPGVGVFNGPYGVALDGAGNIYIADYNHHSIRRLTPGGTLSVIAGVDNSLGAIDGTNGGAKFYFPSGLAIDAATNLYVADRYNKMIRKISPVGTNWVTTTIAGKALTGGSADGTNGNARFNFPSGICVDSSTNLYIGDTSNHTIRKMTPMGTNWVVTTLAGTAAVNGTNDGVGSAARFYLPRGLALDSNGNLIVADSNSHTIRKLTLVGTNWVVTTLAGGALLSGSTPGTNTDARFFTPQAVLFDSAGNLFVADTGNDRISKGTLLSSPPPALPPAFGKPVVVDGMFSVPVTNCAPGTDVVIEASTDLVNWWPVTTNNGALINYSDPAAVSACFYRASQRH